MNPAAMVRVPQPTKRPLTVLDLEAAKAFLAAAGQHRLGALFSVGLAVGLRHAEALGLRWDDINMETGEVNVRRQLERVEQRFVLKERLKTQRKPPHARTPAGLP